MERRYSSSIGLGHMADTSSKGSSDESTRAAMISQPMLPRGPSCRASSETEPASLEFCSQSQHIQFPFSPKDALSGEPTSCFCTLTRAKEQGSLQPKTIFLDPWKLLWGK